MSELRVGVVGVGQRATLALAAHRPGVARVVSCADPSPRGRADAVRLFGPGTAVHTDHTGMAGDGLDAVFVLTPDDRHVEPSLFFLAAGVPVFVEKPLAITVDGCDRLLRAAFETGTRLYVGHNLRHLPVLRRMREMIEEGAIGRVRSVWCRHFVGHGGDYYFKDWHAERARTTGLLLQKGAHDLDVIHWLAGGYSRDVVAMGDLAVYGANPRRPAPAGPAAGPGPEAPPEAEDPARMPDWFNPDIWPPTALSGLNPVVDVEDISMMLTRLDNGVLASYQQCHFTPDYWRNYTVIGDEGRLENFGDGLEDESPAVRLWNRRRSGYRADADRTETVSGGEHPHGGADDALVREFLRFAASGGPTETSPVAAREAVAAGTAATASLRAGGTRTEVPPLAPGLVRYFAAHQEKGPGARPYGGAVD
ncbi:Gfo/Idh/MocA family protein [Streptomyces sp. DW26H14]|uniref:Gfo/Idh/MocA family protein n=1 Tax=Streptomyces sp. DW26H14 TaxID=3435395 RepID=UPI00403E2609